jgi:hypothetical protein
MKIKSEKQMRKEEYLRNRKRIQDDYDQDMAALKRLYPEFSKPEESEIAPNGDNTYGKLSKLMKQAIESHPTQQFTLQEMLKWVKDSDPGFGATVRTISVSNTLGRFWKKLKIIDRVSDNPATYKKR